jgi:hypothetical protein
MAFVQKLDIKNLADVGVLKPWILGKGQKVLRLPN